MSAKEYRDYAAESRDWAKTASSDQERVTFLDMAKTWLQAAAIAERQSSSGNGATPPTHSVSSGPPLPQSQSLQSDP
jgi:hypothetical protein